MDILVQFSSRTMCFPESQAAWEKVKKIECIVYFFQLGDIFFRSVKVLKNSVGFLVLWAPF